jgi:hypothetical protein
LRWRRRFWEPGWTSFIAETGPVASYCGAATTFNVTFVEAVNVPEVAVIITVLVPTGV